MALAVSYQSTEPMTHVANILPAKWLT